MVYILIIALTGVLVYRHAVENVSVITAFSSETTGRNSVRAAAFGFMLYAAPLISGGMLLLFMLKPFFSRQPEHTGRRTLKRSDEPILFDFVGRICRAVNSPVPSRIDIDCQINASAGFSRGLLSFFGNDLVLTIGMPLVAGLTMRQFGGVLAHEFGHFSQGAGMRFSWLIRTMNYWFARLVYERDSWDEWLEDWSRRLDI
ncbi:MAG: M48 family metallopeptidase, partial [Planctomycetaceae bacterium]